MRSLDEMVVSLHQRGISMRAQDGELRIKAAKGTLRNEELVIIRSRREELRQLLEVSDLSIAADILPRSPDAVVPATPFQARVLSRLEKNWWCTHAVRITGPLSVATLRQSIHALIERHESLRTRFVLHGQSYQQHIDTSIKQDPLDVHDLAALSAEQQISGINQVIAELCREHVDASVGPLFRAQLFIQSANEHVLVLLWDHLITDYESITATHAELWALYRCLAQRLSLPPSPRIQFGDYALWLNRTYVDWLRTHATYWQEHLKSPPRICIPKICDPTSSSVPIDATIQVAFGEKLTEQLLGIARRERTLLSMIVLTVYVAVMSRWCASEDLIVAFVSNGRNRPELHGVMGFIAHHLPLRLQVGRTERFLDLLKRVEAEFRLACGHDDFDRVPDLVPDCQITAESYFNWTQSIGARSTMRVAGLTVETTDLSARSSPSFLPSFRYTEAGIKAVVRYRADLYPQPEVERFVHNLRAFAQEFERYVPGW